MDKTTELEKFYTMFNKYCVDFEKSPIELEEPEDTSEENDIISIYVEPIFLQKLKHELKNVDETINDFMNDIIDSAINEYTANNTLMSL